MIQDDELRTWWATMRQRLSSRLSRLTLSYLAVILVMSLGFSFVIYNTSTHELRRQMPPPELFDSTSGSGRFGNFQRGQDFFEQRYEEGRLEIIANLILTNVGVIALGAAVSYYLAVRTLRPIERALEAQSRFASDASHELRTPLAVIQTENEVALRKPKLTLNEAREVLGSNIEEVIKLRQLAEGLLRLAREEPGEIKLETVSLPDIATDAMNHVLKQAQTKRITIEETMPRLKVMGEASSLKQAVVILLDNAIKYSPAKSTVQLTAVKRSRNAIIRVRDTGVGIPAKNLPHIFDRFYRVDQSRTSQGTATGYGLGLALAKQIVEQQGGEIDVRSTVNKGSTFSIRLPLV